MNWQRAAWQHSARHSLCHSFFCVAFIHLVIQPFTFCSILALWQAFLSLSEHLSPEFVVLCWDSGRVRVLQIEVLDAVLGIKLSVDVTVSIHAPLAYQPQHYTATSDCYSIRCLSDKCQVCSVIADSYHNNDGPGPPSVCGHGQGKFPEVSFRFSSLRP